MTFDEFSRTNNARCKKTFHELFYWTPRDWTNAIAGEVGETCNITKKLHRLDTEAGRKWNKPEDRNADNLKLRAAKEAADALIYIDLFIQSLGFFTEDIVKEVFNSKSNEIGCNIILGEQS